jgi:hypothetical protein
MFTEYRITHDPQQMVLVDHNTRPGRRPAELASRNRDLTATISTMFAPWQDGLPSYTWTATNTILPVIYQWPRRDLEVARLEDLQHFNIIR